MAGELLPYTQSPDRQVEVSNTEEALLSRIPTFSDSRKTDWLGYRGVGFSEQDACLLAGVSSGVTKTWLENDPLFRDWAQNRITHLQRNVGRDILRLQFARNMHLNLRLQYTILYKAATDYASLTESEVDMLKIYSKLYSPADLLNMMKATTLEETDEPNTEGRVPVINVIINGEAVTSREAKRAAADHLLNRMTVTPVSQDIDGEFSVVDDGHSSA